MKKYLKHAFVIIYLIFSPNLIGQKSVGNKLSNQVLYFQTDWGFEEGTEVFIKKAKAYGYDGIETWAPIDKQKQIQILRETWRDSISRFRQKINTYTICARLISRNLFCANCI